MKLFTAILLLSSSLTFAQTMQPKYESLVRGSGLKITSDGMGIPDLKAWTYQSGPAENGDILQTVRFNQKAEDKSDYHEVSVLKENKKMKALYEQRWSGSSGKIQEDGSTKWTQTGIYNSKIQFNKAGEFESYTECEDDYLSDAGFFKNQLKSECITITPMVCAKISSNLEDFDKIADKAGECFHLLRKLDINTILNKDELATFNKIELENSNDLIDKSLATLGKTNFFKESKIMTGSVKATKGPDVTKYNPGRMASMCDRINQANLLKKPENFQMNKNQIDAGSQWIIKESK